MRRAPLSALLLLVVPLAAPAEEFRTVCGRTVSEWLQGRRPVAVVDLQSPAEFEEHHYEGAIAAGGKPGALDRAAKRLAKGKGDVVVVTDDGGESAVRGAKRLAAAGVSPKRIAVLEGGMEAAAAGARCDCCTLEEGEKK